jgi:hypothetical protein
MQSNMDKPHNMPAGSPGYETRDADSGGIFKFLVYLTLILVFSFLASWGVFRYFAKERSELLPNSAFAGASQSPASPQLQVNPRQEMLNFRAQQEQSLESYAWENRSAGTVRVPIERAMELLLQKGVPVTSEAAPAAENSTAKGNAKQ